MYDTQMEATRFIIVAILIIELICSTDIKGVGVEAETELCEGKPCLLTGLCRTWYGSCTCTQGYKFEDETNTKCVDRDECGSHFHDPCGHRGICHNFIGDYSCSCLQGWRNNSHCLPSVASVTNCVPGYEGYHCDDSKCGHHGYAETVGVDDYRCICSDGWTHISEKGVCDIDIDECEQTDVCSDKGICNNTDGSYECACLSGWEGANCSTYNCTVRACKNGGTCVDSRCICIKNWTGNDCSSYVPTDIDSLVPGIADRMLLYGSCGLLMLLIILLLVSIWCACKNKKQRTISPNRTMWTMDQNGRFQRKLYSNKTPSVYGDLPYL